ncbi:hypothetical protein ElyMa_003602100 [Elysia marginata]|uniref:Uncharacterized protein n=1 Tax=Elysia marginata TaxID=1093978 RepID=A0AAV4ERE9_9GAST|nr:hypothetical protein ElyMa_003602100 [Elysia marginata]
MEWQANTLVASAAAGISRKVYNCCASRSAGWDSIQFTLLRGFPLTGCEIPLLGLVEGRDVELIAGCKTLLTTHRHYISSVQRCCSECDAFLL